MKTSQITAKIVVRLFFLLLLISLVPYFYGDNTKLQHLNLIIHQNWTLIFPAILVASFLTLFVSCTVKKYQVIELNWLLVINTIVLMACCIAVYIRIYKMVN